MTTAEVLRAALIRYVASPTHVSIGTPMPEGCECPVTAIYGVTDPLPMSAEESTGIAVSALDTLRGVIRASGGRPVGIPSWNATHTTEQVVDAFERAIEIAEAG